MWCHCITPFPPPYSPSLRVTVLCASKALCQHNYINFFLPSPRVFPGQHDPSAAEAARRYAIFPAVDVKPAPKPPQSHCELIEETSMQMLPEAHCAVGTRIVMVTNYGCVHVAHARPCFKTYCTHACVSMHACALTSKCAKHCTPLVQAQGRCARVSATGVRS